jgi:hypothetical protein
MTRRNSAHRRAARVILAGTAAVAMFALFDAASQGSGAMTVASGSVRLVDNDMPAPPPLPGPPPGVMLAPGLPWPPPWPAGAPLSSQPPSMVLPDGTPLPSLPPGVSFSPELQQEIAKMYMQGKQMRASPPPNVPDEVCRYNTVRVPCP